MTKVVGASWAVEVTYACRCGVHYRATRWRWIDADAAPEEVERTRREGPLRGRCPGCGASASGQCEWLELEPSTQRCLLILAGNQRHAVAELMRDHFAAVVERVNVGGIAVAEPWILRPLWRFEDEAVGVRASVAAEDPEDREDPIVWSGPVMVSNLLVLIGSNGMAQILSPFTGQKLGETAMPDGTIIAPVIANGMMYVLTNEAELVALR